uniref:Nitrous oxide reductase n=1 Tax=Steinernema glaseri TaxID=37863 RepID=A0A1I7Y2Y6_9BILA
AAQVGTLGQQLDLLGRHMALDELAVDHPGVARRQARRHAQALLDCTHVRLHMVIHAKAVVAQVADPFLAATAVGVAVHIDGLAGLGQRTHGQQAEGNEILFQHRGSPGPPSGQPASRMIGGRSVQQGNRAHGWSIAG